MTFVVLMYGAGLAMIGWCVATALRALLTERRWRPLRHRVGESVDLSGAFNDGYKFKWWLF